MSDAVMATDRRASRVYAIVAFALVVWLLWAGISLFTGISRARDLAVSGSKGEGVTSVRVASARPSGIGSVVPPAFGYQVVLDGLDDTGRTVHRQWFVLFTGISRVTQSAGTWRP